MCSRLQRRPSNNQWYLLVGEGRNINPYPKLNSSFGKPLLLVVARMSDGVMSDEYQWIHPPPPPPQKKKKKNSNRVGHHYSYIS